MEVPGFNNSDLKESFAPQVLARGREYERLGRVERLHWNPPLLEGDVRGTRSYHVRIQFEETSQGTNIFSSCECPFSYNCKHAVAVLMNAGTAQQRMDTASAFEKWVGRLHQLTHVPRTPLTRSAQNLLYVLNSQPTWSGATEFGIEIWKVYVRKDDSFGRRERHYAATSLSGYGPAHVIDREVMDLIGNDWTVTPRMQTRALELLASSGRLYYENIEGRMLFLGPERQGKPRWRTLEDGSMQPTLAVEDADLLLPTAPPWYLDLKTHDLGPVNTDIEPVVAQQLISAPPIRPADLTSLLPSLVRFAQNGLPLPEGVTIDVQQAITPRPLIRLSRGPDGDGGQLTLRFLYNGIETDADGDALIIDQSGEQAVAFERMPEAEFKARTEVAEVLADERLLEQRSIELGWEETALFRHDQAPQLRERGFEVMIDDDLNFSLIDHDDIAFEFVDIDNDWFSLSIQYQDRELPLLPILARVAAEGLPAEQEKVSIALPDQSLLIRFDSIRIRHIIAILGELLDDGALPRLPRSRAHELFDLDDRAAAWSKVSSDVRSMAEQLQGRPLPPVPQPSGVQATMRDYQIDALAWLAFLKRFRFGGILADDMGLGKTLQTLAHLMSEKQAGRLEKPALVVAPTSLMGVWRGEASRFTPTFKVRVLHGADRNLEGLVEQDLVVTSYALVRLDSHVHTEMEYGALILDEAQYIKNPRSKTAKVVREIRTEQRLCLTGTPLENHLEELWAQFDFLMPGFLGGVKHFRTAFRRPIEQQQDEEQMARLNRRIRPFILRRTKDQVAAELPAKTEIIQTVALEDEQAVLYEVVRQSMEKRVRDALAQAGLKRSSITVLDALLKLRQVCCDSRLVKLDSAKNVLESAKLDALMGIVPELIEDGRRILLFSQFTSMLKLIEDELRERGIQWTKLTGNTRNREAAIDRFTQSEVPIFLISLKAGGTGLTLTEADTVIHYDPWWNPAVEQQATDRAHRIGQDKPVFVYKLIAEGTVEEKIHALQQRKQGIADAILSEKSSLGELLDEATLQELFAPVTASN